MKTNEETLRQWALDEIVFDGCGDLDAHGDIINIYTRAGMETIAQILNDESGVSVLAYLDEELAKILQKYRVGGPSITGQLLAQFVNLKEVEAHYRKNDWLDMKAIERNGFRRYIDEHSKD